MVKTKSPRKLRGSNCRKKRVTVCKKMSNCSWAKGKKRSFCRRKNSLSRRRKTKSKKPLAWPDPLKIARKAMA